ncbi:MAG TPA: adenylate/guanylate cyclase domain-containing protein [Candidatus Wallbacteria bacterium]|nr:MAG: Adenylate and Guanylate cyclase catalytic domain protein [bacterium ADurb.Bin243]HOD40760.1 adenylate/guanylate cyclase domain-containing protein [Candidatus Wallbacteria bacterium]HPG57256.1 adenylate/guanylate cyclase domain-containing protein [Candidatus Wallbacteria bacterium]
MGDINDQANSIKEKLIGFMKTREMGDPIFNNTMQMIAKLKNAQSEALKLSNDLSQNRENTVLVQAAQAAAAKLQKIVDECENYLEPKLKTSSSAAAKNDKVIAVPKELTFISIDVQGSEDLKQGEDAAKVSKAFSNYFSMVEKIMRESSVKKYSWAGDGFIAYFDAAENAIVAAISLICSMTVFNLTQNPLAKNFRIRIGISTGEDYFDEKSEIGKMTSKVIDLAGYLQKKAEIKTGVKTLARALVSTNTILKIHKHFNFQRTLKLDKQLVEADDSKKVQAMSAFEIVV